MMIRPCWTIRIIVFMKSDQTVRPLRFSKGIQRICLPEADDGSDEKMSPCVSTGWGLMKDEEKDKDRAALQQVSFFECRSSRWHLRRNGIDQGHPSFSSLIKLFRWLSPSSTRKRAEPKWTEMRRSMIKLSASAPTPKALAVATQGDQSHAEGQTENGNRYAVFPGWWSQIFWTTSASDFQQNAF